MLNQNISKENFSPKVILWLSTLFVLAVCTVLLFCGPEMIQSRYYKTQEILRDSTGKSDQVSSIELNGQMGDAFGGTIGPLIAIIAAALTFAAFYLQYVANKEQRIQFAKQANDTTIERFENRFFELLRIHRDNVEEQNIQNIITGRKAFTTYYFELRYIYFTLEFMHDTNPPSQKLEKEELTNLAYLIFFFGIGHVTQNVFLHLSPKYANEVFFKNTINKLKTEKDNYSEIIKKIELAKNRPGLQMPVLNDLVIEHKGEKAIFMQIYQPFTGHGTKIGHYFRHLFQMVRYAANQENEKLFPPSVKYSYIVIIRAQLSNFEQILFYYNSVSLLGMPWVNERYIQDYELIRNLPLSFADFGILPKEKFENEIKKNPKFFDWEQLKNAMS